jgi:hypothetical protein
MGAVTNAAVDKPREHGETEGKTLGNAVLEGTVMVNAALTEKSGRITRVQRRCCESRGWKRDRAVAVVDLG